jgi:hypothetical protein
MMQQAVCFTEHTIVQQKRTGRVQKIVPERGERGGRDIRCNACPCPAPVFRHKKRSAPGSDSLNIILLM